MNKEELLNDFESVRNDLYVANNGYQYAQTKDEIDYYSYTIKALQCKFSNILNRIRKLENVIIKE